MGQGHERGGLRWAQAGATALGAAGLVGGFFNGSVSDHGIASSVTPARLATLMVAGAAGPVPAALGALLLGAPVGAAVALLALTVPRALSPVLVVLALAAAVAVPLVAVALVRTGPGLGRGTQAQLAGWCALVLALPLALGRLRTPPSRKDQP